MIRGTIPPLVAVCFLVGVPPASAQVIFGPAGGYTSHFNYGYQQRNFSFGGGYRYSAPIYGYSVPYTFYYAPPPLVVVVPPPRVNFRGREPVAPVQEPFPTVDDFAPARVDAAVKRGDFLVVKPGQRIIPVAAAIPLPKPPVEPKALAAFLIKSAREAFEAEQIGRASERFRAAIVLQPNEAQLRFWLAQTHLARGEYTDAATALRAGLTLNPDWPSTPYDLKELYGQRGTALADDLRELQAILAANPGDHTLQFVAGCSEWFSGHRQAALKLFERARSDFPTECQRFFDAAKQ